ncbi:hypothetical protein JHK85_006627 [Glycine max]|nr:hypothetical protein JHK85_006627 [Glycine max]
MATKRLKKLLEARKSSSRDTSAGRGFFLPGQQVKEGRTKSQRGSRTMSPPISHATAEYTILENGDGDSPHVQKANIPVEKGGYLIYGTTHIHSGIVNVTLYGQHLSPFSLPVMIEKAMSMAMTSREKFPCLANIAKLANHSPPSSNRCANSASNFHQRPRPPHQMAESDGSNNSFEGSTNDEVTLMSRKFKQMLKKKEKFQCSSRRKNTIFKKKCKEENNEIIYFECRKLGLMKAKCPQLKKNRYFGDKKKKSLMVT